jgi:hypothetical protein
LVPRCHGECGSAKQIRSPVASSIRTCWNISLPWSQVKVRRKDAGSLDYSAQSVADALIAEYSDRCATSQHRPRRRAGGKWRRRWFRHTHAMLGAARATSQPAADLFGRLAFGELGSDDVGQRRLLGEDPSPRSSTSRRNAVLSSTWHRSYPCRRFATSARDCLSSKGLIMTQKM